MYNIPQDLRAKSQIIKGINIADFMFVITIFFLGYLLSAQLKLVVSPLIVPFNIFNALTATIMVLPSPWNKQKKIYESILYMLLNDKYTYHSEDCEPDIHNQCISNKIIKKELEEINAKEGMDINEHI